VKRYEKNTAEPNSLLAIARYGTAALGQQAGMRFAPLTQTTLGSFAYSSDVRRNQGQKDYN